MSSATTDVTANSSDIPLVMESIDLGSEPEEIEWHELRKLSEMSQLSSNPVLHAMIPRLGDDYASIIILCMSFQLEDLTMFRFRDLVDAETLDHTRSLDIETLVSKFRIHHDQLTQCRAAFAETVNSYSTTTGKGIGVPIFSSSRIVSLFLSFLVYKNLIFEVLKTFNLIQNELKRN